MEINFKVENLQEIKSINENETVHGFLLLNDNRLLVSMSNSTIKIYNSETFE